MSPLGRLFAVTALVAGLSSCSNGDLDPGAPAPSAPSSSPSESGPPRPVDPEVRDGIAALWAGDNPREEDSTVARCFADEFLARTDASTLEHAGLLVDGEAAPALPQFDRALAEPWVDAQLTCLDFVEASSRALATQARGNLDRPGYEQCVRDSIDAATIRAALVAGLVGELDDPAIGDLSATQRDCAEANRPE